MVLLDFLYPPKCKICSTKIKRGVICPFCFEKLEKSENHSRMQIDVDGKTINAHFLFPYDNDAVKQLLFALKRKADRQLFEIARDMYLKASECNVNGEMTAVVNVPRSVENVRKYGYDHVKIPCKLMCRKNKNMVYCPVLKRKGKSAEQKNLDAVLRQNNVKGKFLAIKKDIPKNILLVDDVVTTGSTAGECIRELYKIYPDAEITCVFLAHTN